MNTTYLSLGSNLGDREAYLLQAIELLTDRAGKVLVKSSIYSTSPWGNSNQGDFLNQVTVIETILSANELLEKILAIEEKLGRKRDKKWEARTIDIDILFYNSEIIRTATLTVPHPFLHERKFTLAPLAEIAPNFIHPILNQSIKTLLADIKDLLDVQRYK